MTWYLLDVLLIVSSDWYYFIFVCLCSGALDLLSTLHFVEIVLEFESMYYSYHPCFCFVKI